MDISSQENRINKSSSEKNDFLFSAYEVSKIFTSTLKGEDDVLALDKLSLQVKKGEITALVGPDGAGKTTFLRIVARLLNVNEGRLVFDGLSYDDKNLDLNSHIAYMPQKFGLYEDLTVQENLDLYADLKSIPYNKRKEKYNELLEMCAMSPFTNRLAGKLSGGMKQKLGLICTLLSSPKLLLLDEPTVGVDPLSRRELWEIVEKQNKKSEMSLIVSTSYLDEAEKCDSVLLLFEGKTLAYAKPKDIIEKSKKMNYLAKLPPSVSARKVQSHLLDMEGMIDALPQGDYVRFVHRNLDNQARNKLVSLIKDIEIIETKENLEDSFMLLLKEYKKSKQIEEKKLTIQDEPFEETKKSVDFQQNYKEADIHNSDKYIIKAENVSRFFGDFIAVDNVSFSVKRGEVFGLLGPNGAGKTTTFRMLCGLLPSSKGELFVDGINVNKVATEARKHIGYVAQKFSLYGTLSTMENLEFFAGIYGLSRSYKKKRIKEVIEEFRLEKYLKTKTENLPGGYKQRLAMAVGLLHEPSILFLDEATSGADPIARREFWQRISKLSEKNVTIIVTTHFMEEAEYCDRVLIQDKGRMLAIGKPQEIRMQVSKNSNKLSSQTTPITMETAFIKIVENARDSAKIKEKEV